MTEDYLAFQYKGKTMFYERMSFWLGEADKWKTRDEMPPPGEHLASDGVHTWLMPRLSPPHPLGPQTFEKVKWWRRVFPFFATDKEFEAIDDLASQTELTPQQVMSNALRLYQAVWLGHVKTIQTEQPVGCPSPE
jgi:hypothetical protein